MRTGRAGPPTNLALEQSSYAAWPPGSRISITLPMEFATSWLSGLSNAGKPKHSFVIAVRRAKSIDKIAAPQQTSSPENSRHSCQLRPVSIKRSPLFFLITISHALIATRVVCSAGRISHTWPPAPGSPGLAFFFRLRRILNQARLSSGVSVSR
jgi:hypothetical protein